MVRDSWSAGERERESCWSTWCRAFLLPLHLTKYRQVGTPFVATLNAQRIDRRFIYPIFRYLVLYLYIFIQIWIYIYIIYIYIYIYIKPGSLKIRGTLTCPSEAPMFELPVPAWNVPVFDAQTHLSTVLREASVHRQWWIYHIYTWCDSYLDPESCL